MWHKILFLTITDVLMGWWPLDFSLLKSRTGSFVFRSSGWGCCLCSSADSQPPPCKRTRHGFITVVSSANVLTMLELCVGLQSRVKREYRRGLSTEPWGAPLLRVMEVEVWLPMHSLCTVWTHTCAPGVCSDLGFSLWRIAWCLNIKFTGKQSSCR